MGKLIRFLAVIALLSVVTSVAAVALAPQLGSVLTANDAADISEVELTPLAQRSVVLAADGSLYAVLHGDQNRKSVPLEEMPRVLIDTVLAVEDEHFFEHEGVNLRSTMRALLANVEAGDIEQGGSTITQQLVKNSTDVGIEQTMDRKVKEAVLAVRLEDQLTKREILERYLNTVYLGNTAYGVQAAAELYFGKDAKDLDQTESAFLAGVIQNPVQLDPYRRPELVVERRSEVVGRLLVTGQITEDEARFIRASPIPTERNDPPLPDDPFLKEVRTQLLADERLGATREDRAAALYTGGLTIHTTIDPRVQNYADAAVGFGNPDPTGFFSVAVASVEPGTGAVRAMAGEAVVDGQEKNILTGTGRQPGSSFKPFVLAAYLESGGSPNDTVNGVGPCTFPNPGGTPNPYPVSNFDRSRGGVMDIRRATTSSNNCAYVRLGIIAGLDQVQALAEKIGYRIPAPNLSMPLGVHEVSPVQQAAAYATFANGGEYHAPYFVDQVLSRDGEVLIAHEPTPVPVVSPDTAAIVTDLLADNVIRGTGTRARFPDRRDAAGKTGTAQDHSDAWFAGYIPQMSTAVWMGNAQAKVPMENVGGVRRVTGGSHPATIWGGYMAAAFGEIPPVDFPPLPDVRSGTRAMTPFERMVAAQQEAEARERARRAAAEAARRPQPTAPPATRPPSTQPPEPSRPDRAPGGGGGGGGGGEPPPLTPPGGEGDGGAGAGAAGIGDDDDD